MDPDGAKLAVPLEIFQNVAALPGGGVGAYGSPASPSSKRDRWQHPVSFYCPISQQCMRDPVVLPDGHTYERQHIERWLQEHDTSPVTGAKLGSGDRIFPNHALRNAVEEYFQQVFCVHRRAIRTTLVAGGPWEKQGLGAHAALLRTVDALMQCSLLVNAELSTEQVLRQIMGEARTLVGAEAASVFLLDHAHEELYSTVNSTDGELRIPITAGIAGHVAKTGEPLLVQDAYGDARFDRSVDAKTGFRTRHILCVPLKSKRSGVLGVVQLINKTSEGVLSRQATESQQDGDAGLQHDGGAEWHRCFTPPVAKEPQEEGGEGTLEEPRFTDKDLQFLLVFASQAASAVDGSVQGAVPRGAKHEDRSLKTGVPVCVSSVAASLAHEAPHAAEVTKLLSESLDGWQMDTLDLSELTGKRPLNALGLHLFDRLGLVDRCRLDRARLAGFLTEIERGYDDANPYHNSAHAASVLHMMHALLSIGGVAEAIAPVFRGDCAGGEAYDGQLERMACLVAAAVHDYEHLGLSNDFLTKTHHERALRYNDRHVNEHHHSAAAFAVLHRPECNFLPHLPASDYRRLRGLVVELVLATDMAEGAAILKRFGEATAASPGSSPFIPTSSKSAVLLLQVAIKCADIGHLALGWELHGRWVGRLEAEFFAQGDREKALGLSPVSFLMDRGKPGVSKSQVGFLDYVALPLFRTLVTAAPMAAPMLEAVEDNTNRWRDVEATRSAGDGGAA